MEELQRALGNHGLAVSKLAKKGRGLLATKDFQPGEVIITQEPYVCVSKNGCSCCTSAHYCDACFQSTNLKMCARCKIVYYCSTKCQMSEWKLHRLECKAFANAPVELRHLFTSAVRLIIRLHCRAKLESQKAIPASAMDNYNLVKALVARMDLSKIDDEERWDYAMKANLVSSVLQWPDINKREVAENFSRMTINSHTIFDSELKQLGEGLYPVISFINHSCLPNCAVVFEGTVAVVRALQHIPKGSEVLTSYIELTQGNAARQEVLKEKYHFTCTCLRCMKGQFDDSHETAVLEGYRCTNNECYGVLYDYDDKGFLCQKCGLLRSDEEIVDVVSEVMPLVEKAEIVEKTACSSNTYQELIAMYKTIETLQRKVFNDCSIFYLPAWEGIIQNSMKMKDWGEALTYSRKIIAVYQRVYSGSNECNPSLGLKYYSCGKLEGRLGEYEDAVKSLTKAVDILKIPYGTSTPFMKDLFRRLEEARAEAFINGVD